MPGHPAIDMVIDAVDQNVVVIALLLGIFPARLKRKIVDPLGDFFQVVDGSITSIMVHGKYVNVVNVSQRVGPLLDGVGCHLAMQKVFI